MTYEDIAELVGVPVATLYVWRQRGKLPEPDYRPAKRQAMWERSTIEEWMREREPVSTD
jgi:predicted site-specific integrase-resolvase